MPRRFASAGPVLLLLLLGAALVFLAVLQYRWIGEVSAGEEQRAHARLDLSSRQFAQEVERHFGRIVNTFQGMQDEDQLPQRMTEWTAGAQEPALIRALYVLDGAKMQRFDAATETLVAAEWPPELLPVRQRLELPLRQRMPLFDEVPAIVLPLMRRPPAPAGPPPAPPPPRREDDPRFGDPGPPGGQRDGPPFGERPDRAPFGQRNDGPPFGQRSEGAQLAQRPDGPPQQRPRRPATLIAVIDREVLANVLMANLARHFFAADDQLVIVDAAGATIWRSSPRWDGSRPDVETPLLNIGPRPPSGDGSRWQIRARHGGVLAASIESARRRNLAVSFAVLLVLAITTVLLAMLLRRAEALRRRQMEFVAGITHELNTPLAALTSAGQNLADGIIATPEQVARYGSMIVKESRRLTNMVAQVLDFAGLASNRAPRVLEPVAVPELIEEACRFVDGVQLDVDVAADLPPIAGDADALARAVQNLVANAVKYGDGKWVGIRAVAEKHGVAIGVDDRGKGIDPRELPHLFEPFFRGAATADRVRGSGLGLTLVRQIAVNHGGRVTVERRRGGGSSFTIHLPVADA
jgi:signal transduction histidine kinase